MAQQKPTKQGTNKFMRQGHTAGTYGNNPSKTPQGDPAAEPRELKAN